MRANCTVPDKIYHHYDPGLFSPDDVRDLLRFEETTGMEADTGLYESGKVSFDECYQANLRHFQKLELPVDFSIARLVRG